MIRDMMGLLALPAMWADRDGGTILQIMTEAIECIVPLRFSYVHVPLLPEQPPVDRLRIEGRDASGDEMAQWITATASWTHRREADAQAVLTDTPLGQMRVVRFSMGYGLYGGQIWFGSTDGDFPTTTHLAYMRAATSLATTGLQTARARYEREEASRAKDEFLAMLGHELRNPLSPIVTALQVMELKNNDVLTHEHAIIKRQVGHLRRLVDDLLDVSRITRGKIELKQEALNLKTVLTSALEDVRPVMEERHHSVTAHFPEKEPWIDGDPTRLTQIFTNLLTNAAKYTDPGGAISLHMRLEEDHVITHVRDNGSGLSPRLFPRLFTIFEQGTSTIDRAKGGLGIGLVIVKSLVELHGGTVTAFSQGIGEGSEFTVTLPRLKTSIGRSPAPIDVQPTAAPNERVLLVDDNIDALETLASYLTYQGYEVATANDPVQALEAARTFRPSIAILDIGLPIMDGYQLAGELRNEFPQNLRLLALTGYGQTNDRTRSNAAGFEAHLVKPVGLADLMDAMASDKGNTQR